MKTLPHRYSFGPSTEVSTRLLRKRTAGAVEKLFENGFPYSKKLSMHTSCVNSLALSSGDGRFLASGGDDPFVYIWDLYQENITQPTCGFIGHKGNVFTLEFSSSSKYVFSGDTDNLIHMYDMARIGEHTNRPGSALRTFTRHENSIRAMSSHPGNDEYVTALSKTSVESLHIPEVGSVTFDRTGSKLAVTMLHHRPTIYSLMDPHPFATCSGANAPNGTPIPKGQRSYSNCCTIKHGSFGGPGLETDIYYSAGSDDFRTYVWKIPDLEELEQRRERIAYERWQNIGEVDETGDPRQPVIGFTSRNNDARTIPVDLSTPLFRLGGHKSIVNSTLIHPRYPMIFTSGVERHIVAHSPLPSSPCIPDLPLTPEKVRSVPRQNVNDTRLYVRALLSGRSDDEEDRATIALFDHILREEGEQDLFEVPSRIWDPDDDEMEEDPNEYADDLYL
ncbi:hypothetical protein EUX98_g7186 [Antrodiella citrinella]|uniref:Uncharacterized protein n=1 Tax=Antrodiella citrinella TaxID=2447956 RepID=A0A4S4MM49_9APHY|nr:hypothetical protein EUX98_g7186 [Antrodiella citrinella]